MSFGGGDKNWMLPLAIGVGALTGGFGLLPGTMSLAAITAAGAGVGAVGGLALKGASDMMTPPGLPAVGLPAVAPLPSINSVANTDALKNAAKLEAANLRKRKGMKSTILTQDSSLMSGIQTGKAEALGS